MDPLKTMAGLETTKKAFSLWDEFRKFAFKGNVIDLAVGIIIGTAFSDIVKSLVNNLIMPLISVMIPPDSGYTHWSWEIGGRSVPYGKFLSDIVNFLIIALVLYIFIVKFLGWVMRSRTEEAATPPPPTREEELLTEIRDLLKQKAAPP